MRSVTIDVITSSKKKEKAALVWKIAKVIIIKVLR